MDKRWPLLACLAFIGGCAGKTVPPRPSIPLTALVSTEDYPASALRAEEEGVVQVRLTISVAGRVENCVLTYPSGSGALDSATCRILRSRARFHPALDRKKRPVPGIFDARFTWRLLPE
jgi:protein TonB